MSADTSNLTLGGDEKAGYKNSITPIKEEVEANQEEIKKISTPKSLKKKYAEMEEAEKHHWLWGGGAVIKNAP